MKFAAIVALILIGCTDFVHAQLQTHTDAQKIIAKFDQLEWVILKKSEHSFSPDCWEGASLDVASGEIRRVTYFCHMSCNYDGVQADVEKDGSLSHIENLKTNDCEN